MQVKRFYDLIEWTRELHKNLSARLADGAGRHEHELAPALLAYLAEHEARIEKMLQGFEQQADEKALQTWLYDYLSDEPVRSQQLAEKPYTQMTLEEIVAEVLDFHRQVINLYRYLIGKAEIPEAVVLLEALLDMEEHQAMRLARQTGRLQDL